MDLLDFPDIKSVTNMRTANYKMAMRIVGMFLEGKFLEPDIYHKNAQILPFIQNALVYYETQNLNESKLDLFRMWIDQALLLINPPEQQLTETEAEMDAVSEDQLAENTQAAELTEENIEPPVM